MHINFKFQFSLHVAMCCKNVGLANRVNAVKYRHPDYKWFTVVELLDLKYTTPRVCCTENGKDN